MMNWIWAGLLVGSGLLAGFTGRWPDMTRGAVEAAGTAVTLAIGLVGVMSLWLGLMRLAETAGLVASLGRALRPLLRRLFPDVPADHPAMGAMVMNISANVLGLTNAATPLGLRAMRDLQSLNPRPDTASDAMCTFLAINTGSVQLIPATAIAVLAAHGAVVPTAIIGTTLVATACSSVVGLVVALAARRLPWFRLPPASTSSASDRPPEASSAAPVTSAVPVFVRGGRLAVGLLLCAFVAMSWIAFSSPETVPGRAGWARVLDAVSLAAVPFLLVTIPAYALARGVAAYEEFVEGAREGFQTAVRIIPFLVAMLVAIGCLRGAGGIERLTAFLRPALEAVGYPAELVPMTLLRPLTGSGTLAAFTDLVKQHGADSLLARMGGTLFGSTETTFYVLAVYFGAVGVRRTRHAVLAGLSADLAGSVAAVLVCRAMAG